MARKDHPLFYLNNNRRFRLSCDDLQWIVERGNPKSRRPGKDSGYRGISFVCTWKWILRRALREKKVPISPAGRLLIHCLPDHFDKFRDTARAIGIVESRRGLYVRARRFMHDRSEKARLSAVSRGVWDEMMLALSESANEDQEPASSKRRAL
jgi:hypothetical protein